MGKLDDKVAIVTGAGRGIGRGIVEKLAAEGARVVVSDIDEGSARETARAIGGQSVGLRADVTSKESVEAMVKEVMDHFGRVDVLVNNAGWDKVGPFSRAMSLTGRRSSRSTFTGCSTAARLCYQ